MPPKNYYETVLYVEHLKSERPERQTVIQADEITNLIIEINTTSTDDFIERM